MQSESLVVALKGASPELRDKILRTCPAAPPGNAARGLKSRGPVRLEAERNRRKSSKIVRRLADEGQIVLGRLR